MELLIVLGLILLLGGNGQSIDGVKAASKIRRAYIDGKLNPAFNLIPKGKQCGVYQIFDNKKLVYVGYSATQLYSTFTRHFQRWDDPRQVRVTYPKSENISARILYTNTPRQAEALEKALILKYQPRDNPNKYESYQLSAYDKKQLNEYINREEAPF